MRFTPEELTEIRDLMLQHADNPIVVPYLLRWAFSTSHEEREQIVADFGRLMSTVFAAFKTLVNAVAPQVKLVPEGYDEDTDEYWGVIHP